MFPKLEEIKKLRTTTGLTRDQIAKEVGISRSAIAKYENGDQIPSYSIAIKIFEFLLDQFCSYQPKLSDIMSTNVKTVSRFTTCGEALNLMKKYNYSFIPVIQGYSVVGTISEKVIIQVIHSNDDIRKVKDTMVEKVMIESLPLLSKNLHLKDIITFVLKYNAVLVIDHGELAGIITKADLISNY